jgi:hypothetical protein
VSGEVSGEGVSGHGGVGFRLGVQGAAGSGAPTSRSSVTIGPC